MFSTVLPNPWCRTFHNHVQNYSKKIFQSLCGVLRSTQALWALCPRKTGGWTTGRFSMDPALGLAAMISPSLFHSRTPLVSSQLSWYILFSLFMPSLPEVKVNADAWNTCFQTETTYYLWTKRYIPLKTYPLKPYRSALRAGSAVCILLWLKKICFQRSDFHAFNCLWQLWTDVSRAELIRFGPDLMTWIAQSLL